MQRQWNRRRNRRRSWYILINGWCPFLFAVIAILGYGEYAVYDGGSVPDYRFRFNWGIMKEVVFMKALKVNLSAFFF